MFSETCLPIRFLETPASDIRNRQVLVKFRKIKIQAGSERLWFDIHKLLIPFGIMNNCLSSGSVNHCTSSNYSEVSLL
jgi:hypothetical protein